jgi:hypothetical protein
MALRAANLGLVALTLGLLWAHVLEWPGKLRLDGAAWLAVQQNLYVGFGTVGAAVEVLALCSAWLLAWRLRHRRVAGALPAAAAITAGLLVWTAFTAPVNAALSEWTPATLPPDWTAWRDQWEASHAAHAALLGLAFAMLLRGALRDGEPLEGKRA